MLIRKNDLKSRILLLSDILINANFSSASRKSHIGTQKHVPNTQLMISQSAKIMGWSFIKKFYVSKFIDINNPKAINTNILFFNRK